MKSVGQDLTCSILTEKSFVKLSLLKLQKCSLKIRCSLFDSLLLEYILYFSEYLLSQWIKDLWMTTLVKWIVYSTMHAIDKGWGEGRRANRPWTNVLGSIVLLVFKCAIDKKCLLLVLFQGFSNQVMVQWQAYGIRHPSFRFFYVSWLCLNVQYSMCIIRCSVFRVQHFYFKKILLSAYFQSQTFSYQFKDSW